MGSINICTTPRNTTFGKVKSDVQLSSISILKKARENIGSRVYIGTLGFVGPSRLVVPLREPEDHSEKETQSSATTATACEAENEIFVFVQFYP